MFEWNFVDIVLLIAVLTMLLHQDDDNTLT